MSDFRYLYCPRCATALEPRVVKAAEPERPACPACDYFHYANPKVAVGTIIHTADARLVLVRRAIQPGHGLWVFPGGYVDRGEPLVSAAAREAREECGLEVRIDGLVNVYSYPGKTPIIIVYAATALGGRLQADDECLEVRLFAPNEIPWDALAFPSTRDALRDYLDGLRHPAR